MPPAVALSEVARVVDGDTLRLADGRSVRLIGINAPETAKAGRPAEPYAVAARKRLQTLVDEAGGRVWVIPGAQPQDHYGRTLANVYGADGRSLEARLLEEGLGYQVVIAPNDALHACHALAERAARQAGLGIWRGFRAQPASAIDRSGFAVVTGRVLSVKRNAGGIWLDIEGGLVVQVPPGDQQGFTPSRLLRLRGQIVEARGWVRDRGLRSPAPAERSRWALRLTHPAMLEIVPDAPKVVGSEP